MPSTDRFAAQDLNYQESVLPKKVLTRIAIEAGSKDFCVKYVGLQGAIIGLDRYGESAPANDVFKALGFTVENVIHTVNQLCNLYL